MLYCGPFFVAEDSSRAEQQTERRPQFCYEELKHPTEMHSTGPFTMDCEGKCFCKRFDNCLSLNTKCPTLFFYAPLAGPACSNVNPASSAEVAWEQKRLRDFLAMTHILQKWRWKADFISHSFLVARYNFRLCSLRPIVIISASNLSWAFTRANQIKHF